MDVLSQALLGASLAQSSTRVKDYIRPAAFCGILGGLAPDLDVLIRSQVDPLHTIEYHRHFTHALAFILPGGFAVALFIWHILRYRALSFTLTCLFTMLGVATHGFLDACTSYGTLLYWPFTDGRVAWNIISIVDPIFTFTLLFCVILSLWKKSAMIARTGLVLSFCYLGFGLTQHATVSHFIKATAEERGHTIERLILNPTIANVLLWRAVYQSDDTYYIDAVRAIPFQTPTLYSGTQVSVIDKHTVFPDLPKDSTQRKDIERFSYFSQDFIAMHPTDPSIIIDLRYGTLPNTTAPLWGIRITPEAPNTHVPFLPLREIKPEHYRTFWSMLKGTYQPKPAIE